ncbi:hypothetical protein GGE45_001755 [Rhizobium aethiopicum]|uniref:Uncharacterized protein n=1 Tax=Rhizobium aethiopicum TaxID=1138170 RepID=A0A7W6QB31_9HYPH|nr:hypothetical protein [Rhizobium aethiopicum]MBB4194258.1 hypothetical protein [Rhizobium aethiopicum]MBB4579431.1 hypothetical protein [Rhizobium aethiopicum]
MKFVFACRPVALFVADEQFVLKLSRWLQIKEAADRELQPEGEIKPHANLLSETDVLGESAPHQPDSCGALLMSLSQNRYALLGEPHQEISE